MKFLRLFFAVSLAVMLLCLISSCDKECKHENMQVTTTDPTCTESGKTVHTCPDCTYYYIFNISNPTGHSYAVNTVKSDCENQGYTEYTCACGFSYVADITDALGHDLVLSQKVDADCDSQGYSHYKCSRCELTYDTDYVAAHGHSFSTEVVSPTCTAEGYTVYSCQNCEYGYQSDRVAPLKHSFSTEVTSPTCTAEGYTVYSCKNCEYAYKSDYVSPTGHEYTVSSSAQPTCTSEGYTTYTCACEDSYTFITSPLGHDFTLTTVSPTVSEMGYTEYHCEGCGYSYVGNYVFYSDILDNAYSGTDTVVAKGIDISKWNHPVNPDGSYAPIDWMALKNAGCDYVILKIGSSKSGLEPTFEMDYEGAKAAGLDVGVYFFTYSTNVTEIKNDAEMLISWLDGKQFEYPIYLDLEDAPSSNYYPSEIAAPILTEMCLTFFSELQKQGYYTGLYVNNNFLFNILQTDNMIELFDIWYARYPSDVDYEWNAEDNETFVWNTEKYGEPLGMWQYCCTGTFDSISGALDFNYAYKDYPTIIKYYGFNGFSDES
ncbi:MAG: hypothetical protein E7592_02310 [Ruminococcaceae bacterium]|nr:hypothetical protein [Oscillospiraceae bacterium]